MRNVFIGSDGLRSIWRVLLFALVLRILFVGVAGALRHVAAASGAEAAQAGMIALGPAFIREWTRALLVLVLTLLFLRVERRQWADAGLSWRSAFGRMFWAGAIWGIAAISVELGMTALFGGFRITGFPLGFGQALAYGIGWALVFIGVGIFEETYFRGYLLQTLARATGFWPAALILSLAFAAVHIENFGEGWMGIAEVVLFGLFFCLTIWRTGSLWFAIGWHAAWDFGESFVYAVPDSGLLAKGHLVDSDLSGPWWLSGGSVGPEGSLICIGVLVLMTVLFVYSWPTRSRV